MSSNDYADVGEITGTRTLTYESYWRGRITWYQSRNSYTSPFVLRVFPIILAVLFVLSTDQEISSSYPLTIMNRQFYVSTSDVSPFWNCTATVVVCLMTIGSCEPVPVFRKWSAILWLVVVRVPSLMLLLVLTHNFNPELAFPSDPRRWLWCWLYVDRPGARLRRSLVSSPVWRLSTMGLRNGIQAVIVLKFTWISVTRKVLKPSYVWSWDVDCLAM